MLKLLTLIVIMACLVLGAAAISIYEVQYTSFPGGDGTYPSPYVGKKVSLEGIVTATNYKHGGYFINETLNGPWRGILIMDKDSRVKSGDRLIVSGTVSEVFGMTCLNDITQTRITATNYPLPQPLVLTTGQLSRADEAEAYEGVYTRLMNATISASKSSGNKFQVTDGSGACVVQHGSFSLNDKAMASKKAGSQYSSITGIVVYGFSEFSLNPVSSGDVIPYQPTFIQNRSWGTIKSIYK